MHTSVPLLDLAGGEREFYTLVYPDEMDLGAGRLSVLSPLGTALLGYREGDIVRVAGTAGPRSIKIEKIVYQPEAERTTMMNVNGDRGTRRRKRRAALRRAKLAERWIVFTVAGMLAVMMLPVLAALGFVALMVLGSRRLRRSLGATRSAAPRRPVSAADDVGASNDAMKAEAPHRRPWHGRHNDDPQRLSLPESARALEGVSIWT
jgi:regulator of nucleoside diphosphate kinase